MSGLRQYNTFNGQGKLSGFWPAVAMGAGEAGAGTGKRKRMDKIKLQEQLADCEKVLIGLGEEWKAGPAGWPEKAYEALYELVREKDYFIVTMATDARIYETPLGSRQETVEVPGQMPDGDLCCEAWEEGLREKFNRIFPPKQKPRESRWERIVAPCGNETWRQCSRACTKDIWEPGEIPDDCCPHCGAPLTGNTTEAQVYIQEGYLPQWERYTHWLAGTLNKKTLILELGVGFGNPGVIRFPFEKAAYFNKKAFLLRVNRRFPQIAGELYGRAAGIGADSVEWIAAFSADKEPDVSGGKVMLE